jgi:hypothetical protein
MPLDVETGRPRGRWQIGFVVALVLGLVLELAFVFAR